MLRKPWLRGIVMFVLFGAGLLLGGCGKDKSPTAPVNPSPTDATVTFQIHSQDLRTALTKVPRVDKVLRDEATVEFFIKGVSTHGDSHTSRAVVPVQLDGSVHASLPAQTGVIDVQILFHNCDYAGMTDLRGASQLVAGLNTVVVGPEGVEEFAQYQALEALLAYPPALPRLLELPWGYFVERVAQARADKDEDVSWGELKCIYNPRCK